MLSKIARTASRNRARQDLLLPSILLPQQPFTSSIGALQQAAPADDQIEVKVNGAPVQIPKGSTVMQACDAAGIDIPRFCYHPKLSIAGNCRMCLVEVEKSPKPVASCAMPAAPNMNIKTDTELVKKAREGVMEFLLINHPLDCPICDQGGECDLQEQSMHFGSDRSRFTEMKRSVHDKNLGPLVKTVMTRCIHCTRCVRFATEVAGVQDLGMVGRGKDSEIGTYIDKLLTSELSGNVIDLCPVGALTSKPAAFTYRNWELKNTETIDVSDAQGTNTRVDSRGVEVMRILPRLNEDVNEEWLSDKGRFQYDGLKQQRLNIPMVKDADGAFAPKRWPEALEAVAQGLQGVAGNEMKAIAGKLSDAESMVALKDLMNKLGCGNLSSEGGFPDLDADVRSNYVANTTIRGIEGADVILLIGTNPRIEAPVYNARIRKTWLEGTQVGLVGPEYDLTYPYAHLGEGPEALSALLGGSDFFQKLQGAKHPAVILGPGILSRPDRDTILQQVHELVEKAGVVKEDWNGYNILHDAASRVAALDLGFLPSARSHSAPKPKFVYLLGSDDFSDEDVPEDAFVVYQACPDLPDDSAKGAIPKLNERDGVDVHLYIPLNPQGSHGDKGAPRANVILPAAAYVEKEATFVNFEGRTQRTKAAVPMVGDSREDWRIIRAVSEVVGKPLPYDTTAAVQQRLADVAPHLAKVDAVESPMWLNGEYNKAFAERASKVAEAAQQPFTSSIQEFFMTDAISRSSQVMARCIQSRNRAGPKSVTHPGAV